MRLLTSGIAPVEESVISVGAVLLAIFVITSSKALSSVKVNLVSVAVVAADVATDDKSAPSLAASTAALTSIAVSESCSFSTFTVEKVLLLDAIVEDSETEISSNLPTTFSTAVATDDFRAFTASALTFSSCSMTLAKPAFTKVCTSSPSLVGSKFKTSSLSLVASITSTNASTADFIA